MLGCSCSTSMLSYALLAIVLPSFFSCYCKNNRVCFLLSMLCSLSLFFHCFWYFLHQSFDVIFSRLLLSLFSMLCLHYFFPLQLFALHVICFYSVSNTLNNSYFFCLALLASLCLLGFVLVFALIFYAIFKAGRYVTFNIFFFAFAGGNLIMQS